MAFEFARLERQTRASFSTMWLLCILILLSLCVDCSSEASDGRIDALITDHFKDLHDIYGGDHVNRAASKVVLQYFAGNPLVVIETGTSAWGFKSTTLFDSYITVYGGALLSVDKRAKAGSLLRESTQKPLNKNTHLFVDDSVHFLQTMDLHLRKVKRDDIKSSSNSTLPGTRHDSNSMSSPYLSPHDVNMWFYDSWDVDWSNPMPSAIHGYNEFATILKEKPNESLGTSSGTNDDTGTSNDKKSTGGYASNSLIWIDDTPLDWQEFKRAQGNGKLQQEDFEAFKSIQGDHKHYPGKGSLVLMKVMDTAWGQQRFEVLYHGYSLVLRVK